MNLRIWVPILALLVMASAIYLVNTRYQSRALFIKSEQLQLQAQELDVAWR
ncbi:MAG: cell division protein FtsL, partial [Alcaligenaceae bacterium]|nr:cell division protein FtsL [Alcaligenaceae bacterium]